MDERELLIEELADGHRMVGAALSDLSSEVAEWQPGGHRKLDRQPPGPHNRRRGSCRQPNVWGWGVAVRKRRLGGEDRHPR